MERSDDVRVKEVLVAANRAWLRMAGFRERRERYKNFTYGRQWEDMVMSPIKGKLMTEGEHVALSGKNPLTNNMIRQLVKCVIGRYRDRRSGVEIPKPLVKAYRANQLSELDCRALEEFLISGSVIQRVVEEHRPQGRGVWVDNVNPRRFFVNQVNDVRGWDAEMVGMLHDMSLTEVVMRFAKGDVRRAAELREIYRDQVMADERDGFFAAPSGRCRVIEVWTLESQEVTECHDRENATLSEVRGDATEFLKKENRKRLRDGRQVIDGALRVVTHWHGRFISPRGELLMEMVSAIPSGQHPFRFKFYPLTDGEVHSMVEDIVDQQKYVNRLITLIDHIMGSSAKGALLFPFHQKIDDMTWEEIGQQWAACDGIIPYSPRSGEPAPQQVVSNGADAGAYNLLNLEMKLFHEISGVSETLLGNGVAGAKGSAMYESQVRNATVALADLLDTFDGFVESRDELILENTNALVGD